MGTADWQRLEYLFHGALDLNEGERNNFLRANCNGDKSMFRKVRSLLTAHENQSNFLSNPILNLGLTVINEGNRQPSLEGAKIGNYFLKRKLGEGGMGTVYLAQDTRLNREVALKFVFAPYHDNEVLKKQLLREAQAAARLDHPNICPIYGIEEVEGFNFIVMRYVAGESLADLIKEGWPFGSSEIFRIIHQLTNAIGAAHAQGIIHRDIKPGNVMRTSAGQIEVLDFGLAKLINPDTKEGLISHANGLTESSGLVFGTVSYMSPEQLRNERLDYRTDIFSLGILIYELCSGRNPYMKPSQAETISSVLNETPDFSLLNNPPSSPILKKVVRRCLEKERGKRYGSISELIVDLKMVESQEKYRLRSTIPGAGQWILEFIIIVVVVVAGGLYWSNHSSRLHHVAVLPIANVTGDASLDYLGVGISEGIINNLVRNVEPSSLNVKPFTVVSGYKGMDVDPSAVGRQLDTDIVLTGTIERDNERLIATFKAYDTDRHEEIWTTSDTFESDDLVELQEQVSGHLLNGLQISKPTQPFALMHENGEAYRYYLIGQYYWKKRDAENIQKAIFAFDHAIELDPSYAKAYAGLANSYVVQSLVAYGSVPTREAMTKAKAAAKQAIEIDENNCEAHAALGVVFFKYDWNWDGSEAEFQRAIALNPEYSAAHYWYASLLAITGRTEESVIEATRARDLDPFSSLGRVNLARAYYYARNYDLALEEIQRAQQEGNNDPKVRYMIGLIFVQQKRYDEALSLFKEIYGENKVFGAAALGFTYAKMGRNKQAMDLIAELRQDAQGKAIPFQEIAIIYAGLNKQQPAIQNLTEAFRERHAAVLSINVEPLYDNIRKGDGFRELVLTMHLIRS